MLGQPVRVITADDACGVEQAEAAAHTLVDAGVGFVVGHLCSHSSLVAAAVYEVAGVPMLTTTASHPRLTEEGRGNVFRLIGRDDRQGQIAGDFLAERWPRGKIAILDDGSTYGAGLADQTRRRLRERGVRETLDARYPPGADEYSALVEQLQQAGIEVAYVGGYGPDAARIVRTARQRGDDAPAGRGTRAGHAGVLEHRRPGRDGDDLHRPAGHRPRARRRQERSTPCAPTESSRCPAAWRPTPRSRSGPRPSSAPAAPPRLR